MTSTPAWVSDLAPEWAAVFEAVPRTRFLPDLLWPFIGPGEYETVDRGTDPDAWQRWADTDGAIVTQWDDGNHTGRAPGTVGTSSSSQPSLVAGMLSDLDPQPDEHVLDIGVGTGWTTALLAARVGPDNVTGIEIDPAVATAATQRLAAAGIDAQIIITDGDLGWPPAAPYDRLQVTYAVRQFPAAWIRQIRPGGVIVAPWRTDLTHPGAIARLTVASDGTANGPFTRPAEFMHDRHQRTDWPDHTAYIPKNEWPGGTRESIAAIRPKDLWDTPHDVALFVAGLAVPHVVHTTSDTDEFTAWFYDLNGTSWAVLYAEDNDDDKAEVYQGGPRSLWDEIEAAYQQWTENGQPGHDRLGLTITADGKAKLIA